MTDLLDRLGMTVPVVQAPMAGVSTPEMAAAVSNAGGLGSISVGAVGPEEGRAAIQAVRAATNRAFLVNVFCHAPARADAEREAAWIERLRPLFASVGGEPPAQLREIYRTFVNDDAMLAMLLAERPAVVSFHFGLPPQDRIDALKAAGITLFATATSLDEARHVEAAGCDAIVAQGYEAGGHRGVFDPDVPDPALPTASLVRMLAKETRLPVIATGGIMDGAGIAAVMALGAVAAHLGTAFIACSESCADQAYRALVLNPPERTIITRVVSGRPARCIANAFSLWGEDLPADAVPAYPIAYDAGKSLNAAAKASGQFGYGAQWAGQGVAPARAMPAAELVRTLARELADAR